jgi:hypothetical protein
MGIEMQRMVDTRWKACKAREARADICPVAIGRSSTRAFHDEHIVPDPQGFVKLGASQIYSLSILSSHSSTLLSSFDERPSLER